MADKIKHNPHEEVMSALHTVQAQNVNIINRLDRLSPSGTMTRKMIAEEYGVSLGTIHNAMKSGALKFFKIGRATRFDRQDVEKWKQQ